MSKKENNIKDEQENKDNIKKKEHKCTCSNECTCEEDKCTCGEECKCHDEDRATNEILSKRVSELEDTVLRTQAELLNYRKRKDEETARILKYAEEDILKGFLPILDNFERAIMMDDNNFGDETSKFLEGFRLVYNQTKSLLERFEVREIDCLNKEFDPAIAEAIATEKDKSKLAGIVLKVYQKGYIYKDKVLRPAMVIVNE